jgi:hypothetical protein
MEDKSLHRRIAKYLFTVGTGEVTRGDGHFRFPVPAATLDTDRYRARTSLRGSFISPDCSLRPVDDTATHSGMPANFNSLVGAWDCGHCVCRMPQGGSIAVFHEL